MSGRQGWEGTAYKDVADVPIEPNQQAAYVSAHVRIYWPYTATEQEVMDALQAAYKKAKRGARSTMQRTTARSRVRTVGSRVSIYQGMGESAYGIITKIHPDTETFTVKFDGTIEPNGKRNEPYEVDVNGSSVALDVNDYATQDEARYISGWKRIEAKL